MWALMTSPVAKGLFRAAVDMSGSYVFDASLEQAEADNRVFLEKTGCRNSTCLRRLSVHQVLQVRDGERDAARRERRSTFCCWNTFEMSPHIQALAAL